MKKTILICLAAAALLCLPCMAYGQSIDGIKIVASPKDTSGKLLYFQVTGTTEGRTLFLGTSLYPPQYTNRLKEGFHELVPVTGSFTKYWEVPEKYYGGVFEAALWGEKVPKSKCNVADCFACGKFGYHPEKMQDYASGTLLAAGALKLKIAVAEQSDMLVVTVSGEANNGGAYLGSSFYPKDYKDIFAEGSHDCRQVSGAFKEVYTVPRKFREGKYEIALWKKKIQRSACTNKACIWCQNLGYHLWWLLFSKSGKLDISTP
ncbi:MAG: hypothetical protein RDV48_08695 [Candidatus Eremiobacteraeota bacterium]|nr:hypothetical protein [Candidatus Eremiobacteraeota bacterium]